MIKDYLLNLTNVMYSSTKELICTKPEIRSKYNSIVKFD